MSVPSLWDIVRDCTPAPVAILPQLPAHAEVNELREAALAAVEAWTVRYRAAEVNLRTLADHSRLDETGLARLGSVCQLLPRVSAAWFRQWCGQVFTRGCWADAPGPLLQWCHFQQKALRVLWGVRAVPASLYSWEEQPGSDVGLVRLATPLLVEPEGSSAYWTRLAGWVARSERNERETPTWPGFLSQLLLLDSQRDYRTEDLTVREAVHRAVHRTWDNMRDLYVTARRGVKRNRIPPFPNQPGPALTMSEGIAALDEAMRWCARADRRAVRRTRRVRVGGPAGDRAGERAGPRVLNPGAGVPIAHCGLDCLPEMSADLKAIRERLENGYCEDAVGDHGTPNSPPPRGEETLFNLGKWDLSVAGRASYDSGLPFKLSGYLRRVLARLIRGKGQPVHIDHLKQACGNEHLEDSTVCGYISRLRDLLRDKVRAEPDPIQHHDPNSYSLEIF